MVPRLDERLERHGDRGEPGGHEHRAISALERGHRLLEGERRRRRELPIANDVEAVFVDA